MNYSQLIRRLRHDDRIFDTDENHKIHRILKKALAMRRKREGQTFKIEVPKGQYSGLTKRELAMSGTCETDWY